MDKLSPGARQPGFRSDHIIFKLSSRLGELASKPLSEAHERTAFLREFLLALNRFYFELRPEPEIEALNEPDIDHPSWLRKTEFLAVWDDYSRDVLGITVDPKAVERMARRLVEVFRKADHLRAVPKQLPPDTPQTSLGGLTPRQFCLVRTVHALQDFTQELPAITPAFVALLRDEFGGRIPAASDLLTDDGALSFLKVLGGADMKGNERKRYIQKLCGAFQAEGTGGPFELCEKAKGNAVTLYGLLSKMHGLKSKKANMLLRDMYEAGCWIYRTGLEQVNIIADNRVMRVALRSGIVSVGMGKLLNSLMDQYDLQYGSTLYWTEEAFRRVWHRCTELNSGVPVVSYPGRFDQFIYNLGDGRRSCCRNTKRACETGSRPKFMSEWLRTNLGLLLDQSCPLQDVCPADKRILNPPYAIQNNTWDKIFTNSGGGGGLRGA